MQKGDVYYKNPPVFIELIRALGGRPVRAPARLCGLSLPLLSRRGGSVACRRHHADERHEDGRRNAQGRARARQGAQPDERPVRHNSRSSKR